MLKKIAFAAAVVITLAAFALRPTQAVSECISPDAPQRIAPPYFHYSNPDDLYLAGMIATSLGAQALTAPNYGHRLTFQNPNGDTFDIVFVDDFQRERIVHEMKMNFYLLTDESTGQFVFSTAKPAPPGVDTVK